MECTAASAVPTTESIRSADVSTTGSYPGLRIRQAVVGDAAAIAEIYNTEVLNTVSTFDLVPRTLEQQEEWIRSRSGAFSAIVACDSATGNVLGFASLSRYKDRAAYSTTVEDSVYVNRAQNGRGIGKALLSEVCATARSAGFHSVIARIEATGTASRALHASCGFELVGIEKQVGRKFNRWLDVAVMQLML